MGNRFSNSEAEQFCVYDIHANRSYNKHLVSRNRRYSDEETFQSEKIKVDWNNDEAVNHRSALNSLHNYAIGKMSAEDHLHIKKPHAKKNSIRFADVLEQTVIINRSLLCMESWELDAVNDKPDLEFI